MVPVRLSLGCISGYYHCGFFGILSQDLLAEGDQQVHEQSNETILLRSLIGFSPGLTV